MARPTGFDKSARLFPIAHVSRKPLRTGLEYGMTIQAGDTPSPNVALPVRSSLGQPLLRHRFQISRNIRLLRNYGFAPGNPVLHAQSIPVQARMLTQRPVPTMTRFGLKPKPGATPVFPRTGRPGAMGSVRRFPKAIPVMPNKYFPPVYGQDGAQVQTEG